MNIMSIKNVIKRENYINQMWNDIQTIFGNEKHSYLVVRGYDMYDDIVYNKIENGSHFWRDINLWVENDVDFSELLHRLDGWLVSVGLCNSLPHLKQLPTYVRVCYEKRVYYIYQIKKSTDFKYFVDERYTLSYDNNIQKQYGEKLAKLFGEIVEPITTNK